MRRPQTAADIAWEHDKYLDRQWEERWQEPCQEYEEPEPDPWQESCHPDEGEARLEWLASFTW